MVPTAGAALVDPPAGAESDVLPPGAKAGPWVIEGELGHGGMGAVYAVHHDEIGKRAALKVMHRRLVTSSTAERILLEARVVNQVGHPNIVDIFETGTLTDGRPYIVMERLDGAPLSRRAAESKLLPDQVIEILLQICDALIAAHAAGVVHRDLKLDNVFLIDHPEDPRSPRVKLLDWGIAKVISNDVRHTIEGQLVGTPQYLAPEQARGAAVSPLTDVYSLGVVAFELFLEQLPFEAETSAELMTMHLRATPPRPRELWPDIPSELEHLLLAMLAKPPDARPTMLTVAHTLEVVRSQLELRREPPGAVAWPRSLRGARRRSAPGLAPTEPANRVGRSRRWQLVAGTLALAASAMVFVVTRDGDGAAAARTNPAQGIVPRPRRIAAPPPSPPPAPPPAATPEPVEVIARTQVPDPAAVPPAHHGSRAHHAPRKSPVTPRRAPPVDPDGTLDPYR